MSDTRKPFCYVTKAGKTVRAEILEQYAVKSDTKALQADIFTGQYADMGVVEPLYNPHALANLMELNTYHMRCVKTKARDTAGLGWDLKPAVDEPSEESHALRTRIIEAFDDMPESISAVFDKACNDWESVSYATVEITRSGHEHDGEFASLNHVPSPTIRIHRSGNKFVQMVGSKKRWFKAVGYDKDIDFEHGTEHELGTLTEERRATEMMFWKNYATRSSYYGLPDIIPAIGAIMGDLSRRDYNISFFDNYGVPAYAVFITGNFDPGEPVNESGQPDPLGKTPLEWEIEAHFKTMAKNPHSVLILSLPSVEGSDGEVNIEFQPLAKEIKEASFRLYRQDNRDEVLAAHGVPPYRLGIAEIGGLGGNFAQEATEVYKTSVIQPRQETIQQMINRYVVWGMFEAYDWEFEFAPIDTSDETHDMEIAAKLFDMAAMTPNDLIRNFGIRFGLTESDHPSMGAHYLKGMPIDYIPVSNAPDEVIASLSSLQDRIIEAVIKDAGDETPIAHRGLQEAISGYKKATKMASGS